MDECWIMRGCSGTARRGDVELNGTLGSDLALVGALSKLKLVRRYSALSINMKDIEKFYIDYELLK